jgi:hypothetical protein
MYALDIICEELNNKAKEAKPQNDLVNEARPSGQRQHEATGM